MFKAWYYILMVKHSLRASNANYFFSRSNHLIPLQRGAMFLI